MSSGTEGAAPHSLRDALLEKPQGSRVCAVQMVSKGSGVLTFASRQQPCLVHRVPQGSSELCGHVHKAKRCILSAAVSRAILF